MGSGKKPFQLRLDSEVYSALEAWAQDEFRSLNGQIEYLLVQALRRKTFLPSQNKRHIT